MMLDVVSKVGWKLSVKFHFEDLKMIL